MKTQIFTALTSIALATLVATTTQAALLEGTNEADVLIGQDDDNINNPIIQPNETPTDPNQSLDDADVLLGRGGNDVLIGLLGDDVMQGGQGRDIMIGGLEGGSPDGTLKSDIMFGQLGSDVAIWAGGDGNDAFLGGSGLRDALVFGTIDRVDGVPTLTGPRPRLGFPQGIPTADVTNQGAFCTLERVTEDSELGYAFLVRFRSKATGNLIVTVRVDDQVEQVFCTSETAAAITFADLTAADPQFVEVSLEDIRRHVNFLVSRIIR